MLDHIKLYVLDLERSRRFYVRALAPLSYRILLSVDDPQSFGFGEHFPHFWIQRSDRATTAHVAFSAPDRDAVAAFYAAALAAGGRDNGPPGPRPQYHAGYHGAFVLDPDGNNVEAVCHVGRPPRASDACR